MSIPNTEPVVVMDDALLRDLSDLVYPHGRGASEDARIRAGAQLTREEGAVRRLMGAWLNEGIRREGVRAEARIAATRAPDCFEMNHEARLADHERRWSRIHDWATQLGCPPGVFTLDWLQQEVAERQARAVDLADQLDRAVEECARRGDALRHAERERDEALAEVERLRVSRDEAVAEWGRKVQTEGLTDELIGEFGQAAIDACESLPYDTTKRPEATELMVGRHLLRSVATGSLRCVWLTRAQKAVDRHAAEVERLRAAQQLPDLAQDIGFLWDWRLNRGERFLATSSDVLTMRELLAGKALQEIPGFEWVKDVREAETADTNSAAEQEGLRDVHWVDEGPYRRFTYRDSSGAVWVDVTWCGETAAEQRTTEPAPIIVGDRAGETRIR